MDKLIENIINEKFVSKAQQRFFYAKASDESEPKKERRKWKKWAKEYSDDTNFKKIPEKVKKESDVDEQYFDLNPGDPGHDNFNYVAVVHFANGKKVKEILDHFVDVQAFAGKMGKKSPVKIVVDRFDEEGNKKTKTWFFNYTNDSWELEKKKEEEVDEVVDELGNIATGKEPSDANSKGITQKKTTDQVVKTGAGSMGIHGVHGTHTSLRYWAESDMSKALGFEKTMGDDEDYEDAEEYFKKELGMDDVETQDRLAQLGYDKKLAKKDADKVRLVENPREFIEAYIDEVLLKKSDIEELVSNKDKEFNPIVKKQLDTLKKSLKSNGLTINDVVKYLKNDEKDINEIFDSNKTYPFNKVFEEFDEANNTKNIKFEFVTKDNARYTVLLRIDTVTNNGKLDFEAEKSFNYYKQENTNDNDSIKILNTVIKISELYFDEMKTLYVASSDDKRLRLYKHIAKNKGFKVHELGKSMIIYLK